MKTMQQNAVGLKVLSAAVLAVATSVTAYAPTATAGHGAAWGIGGLLAGSMLTKAHYRDQRAREQAYAAPAPAPAASTAMTPEQKIDQLNKLAAGGYITPEEYKTKKQAILNSL
jgi:hypothetical protein